MDERVHHCPLHCKVLILLCFLGLILGDFDCLGVLIAGAVDWRGDTLEHCGEKFEAVGV